jgi:hypothetical protein
MRSARRRISRILSAALLICLLTLITLNLPFYAGSTLGPTLSWRLEGARLNIVRRPSQNPEHFYVAINSEPLRWNFAAHYYSTSDWFIRIPLWMPLVAVATCVIFSWWPAPRRLDPLRCSRCNYSLVDLTPGTPCPECGKKP